jgi:MoxR-like ATPase
MEARQTAVAPPSVVQVQERLEAALFEIKRVIAGQDQALERVLVCLLSGGHLLIEGVPGLAKTLTIRTVASVLGGSFGRIQFTPDLVPSDLVGTRVYRPGDGSFDTELGPVFCNFLLADEINRAPAKVQSALLEVMQERQVTIGTASHPVPDPFLVMATQNPIESEGTYPLPEAQVDRFMLKVVVDYPRHDEELTVVQRSLASPPPVRQVMSVADLKALQLATRNVYVDPVVSAYAVQLATATRDPAAHGLGQLRPLHQLRREPARLDQPRPRRTRPGAHPGPGVRAAAGRAGPGQGRPAPPPRADLPGPGRGGQRRCRPRPARGRHRAPADRHGPRGGGVTVSGPSLSVVRTPARPGPGPMPEALLRALDVSLGRRVEALTAGDHRSTALGRGTELARIRPYTPATTSVRSTGTSRRGRARRTSASTSPSGR